MKKKLLVLALVLVIAAIAVVCVSCAKEEKKYERGLVTYTVVNKTGKNVTELVMSDNRSDSKLVSKPVEGAMGDGESYGFSITAALENNAPDLQFTFTVEGGSNVSSMIYQKEGTITLLSGENGLTFELSDPAK